MHRNHFQFPILSDRFRLNSYPIESILFVFTFLDLQLLHFVIPSFFVTSFIFFLSLFQQQQLSQYQSFFICSFSMSQNNNAVPMQSLLSFQNTSESFVIDAQNKSGHWSMEENMKYITFLYKNKLKFAAKMKNRKIKLFEEMSEYISSRSTVQCRTHHQKFENKFGSTKNVLKSFKQQLGVFKFKSIVKGPGQMVTLQKENIKNNSTQFKKQSKKKKQTIERGTQTQEKLEISLQNYFHQNQEQKEVNILYFVPVSFY